MSFFSSLINKYKTSSLVSKSAIWYSFCNILQKGISFIVVPLYTRLLTVEEYGKYTIFQSWREILLIFATLNLYCGIYTKAMVDYENDRDRYTSSQQGLSTVVTAVLFGIYILFSEFWNEIADSNTTTMLLLFGFFVFYPSVQFWSVQQRVLYRYKKMVAVTLAILVLTPIVSIILLVFTDLRENAVIWGNLLVQIVFGLVLYVYLFLKGKVFFHKQYWLQALKFNLPLIPHYLSLIILVQSDKILIGKFCGEDKAGIFGIAYSIAMLISIITSAINSTIVPWTYQKLKEKKFGDIKRTTTVCCILVTAMTLCIMLVAPEVISVFGTSEYANAKWIIPGIAIGGLFTFFYGLYSTIEFYYSKTNYVMLASMGGALLNIVANVILLPIFGYIISAYATLLSYFVLWIAHVLMCKKIAREKGFKMEEVYSIKAMFAITAVMIAFMFVCFVTYEYLIMRILVVVAMGVVALMKRKMLMGIFNSLKNK